jgi:hypothetical protein
MDSIRFKKVILALATLFFGAALYAQTSLTVDVPRVVESGESFRLVYTVNAEPSSFNPPTTFAGLDLLAGPSQSRMSSTQIINGKRTESFQISYTYILQASSEGKYTIPSASVIVDGKTYSSQSVVVEVVKSEGKSAKSDSGTTTGTVSSDDLFIRVFVNKNRVVKGEPLTATIKLYTRVSISGFEDVRFPSFNGFWSQETETPQNIEFVRENIDGKIYNAALLRRYLLVPQQSGSLTIDPVEMICQVQIRSSTATSRSIFDDFFDSYQTLRKRVSSTAVRVTVDALPPGAPESFLGGVGEFSLKSSLSRDSVNANEALSLLVTVTGTGNINLIETPKVEIPNGIEVYDTKISDNSSRGSGGASGSKQYEFPLIPRGPGVYTIPGVEFSYFDIAKRRYVTLRSQDMVLRVGRDSGGGATGTSLSLGVNRQVVRSISDDIRYIHTKSAKLRKGNQFFFASLSYFISLIALVLLFFVMERVLSKRIERNRDVAGVKNRRANKVARTRLRNAESLLKQGLYTGFYEELHRAVLGYISDKLNLSFVDLSRDKIKSALDLKRVRPEHSEELLSLLEQCEYARYAPDPGGGEMESNYTRAMNLISRMEL